MRYLAMALGRTNLTRGHPRRPEPEVADDELCQEVPLRRDLSWTRRGTSRVRLR